MGLLFLNLSPLRDFSRIPKILAKMIADAKGWFRSVAVSVLLFYSNPVDYPLVFGFIVSRVPLTWPQFKLLMWPFQCCSLGGSGYSVRPALPGTGTLHVHKEPNPFWKWCFAMLVKGDLHKMLIITSDQPWVSNTAKLTTLNSTFVFIEASVGRSLQLTA